MDLFSLVKEFLSGLKNREYADEGKGMILGLCVNKEFLGNQRLITFSGKADDDCNFY